MLFWVVAGGLLVLVVAIMARSVVTTQSADGGAEQDVQVYRDQLREVERDVARGVLTEDAAERTRLEISRRLLEADRTSGARYGTGPRAMGIGLSAVLVVGVSVFTYLQIGAPGYPDLPLEHRISMLEQARAERPGQSDAEAQITVRPTPPLQSQETLDLVEQLRTILATRPDDVRGFRLLARNEAGLGNMIAAYRAQARVIEILGPDGATPEDYAALGELMVLAAGGYVSPEAETVFLTALEREPRNGTARYYVGLMQAQAGRYDQAWPTWRRLLADSSPDAPWLEPILLQIEDISALAGDPTPLDQMPVPRAGADPLAGPTAEDIDASTNLSMQERIEMIEGMVQGLADRLSTDGGPPQEWARLITSLGVLGNTDAAFGVYSEAILVFEGDRGALDILDAAADQAGVNPG